MREVIFGVIEAFYQKATKDILIGYHFDKFNEPVILAAHLERITSFWEMQLLGSTSVPLNQDKPFHLLFTHLQLSIKKGELGRWVILFHQTLDSLPVDQELSDVWKERIQFFHDRFISHPQMFSK